MTTKNNTSKNEFNATSHKTDVISRFLSVTHKFDLKTIKIKYNGKFKSSKN